MPSVFVVLGGLFFPYSMGVLKSPVTLQVRLSDSILFVQDPKYRHRKMRHVDSKRDYKMSALIIPLIKCIK